MVCSITPVVLNRAFKVVSTFTSDMFIFSLPPERQESIVVKRMNYSQNAWVQILALPFANCVTFNK